MTDSKAQSQDPAAILAAVKNQFDKIESYKANTRIHVDVDFIKVPDRTAEISFRQPDKIKIKTKGFALLPKPGVDFSPASLLKEDHTPIYLNKENINNRNLDVLQVVPKDGESAILISKLWIEQPRNIIRRIETATRNDGIYRIDLFYPSKPNEFDLPDSLQINFEIKRIPLPIGISGDMSSATKKKGKGPVNGKVSIIYLDYLINDKFNRSGK